MKEASSRFSCHHMARSPPALVMLSLLVQQLCFITVGDFLFELLFIEHQIRHNLSFLIRLIEQLIDHSCGHSASADERCQLFHTD